MYFAFKLDFEHGITSGVVLLFFFNPTGSLLLCVLHNRPLSPSPCVYGTSTYWRERRCLMPWLIQPSNCTRVSMRLIASSSVPCCNESNQLHAQIQPWLLLLYQRVLLCGLHRTLPLAWLPPNWMAYIMQVAGCCGEESKADFSLDA